MTRTFQRTASGALETVSPKGFTPVYINDAGTQSGNPCGPVNTSVYKETPSNGGYTEAVINSGSAGSSITVDGSGNIFGLADSNVFIEFLQPEGSYIPGGITIPDMPNGGSLDTIDAITVDTSGNIYLHAYYTVTNMYNGYIPTVYTEVFEEVLSSGTYTPVPSNIGSGGVKGETYYPRMKIKADALGNIFEWAYGFGEIINVSELIPTGNATYSDAQWFNLPAIVGPCNRIDEDAGGNLYVAYEGAGVQKLVANDYSIGFATTPVNATSQDSPRAVEVVNIGNAPLTISTLSYPADFPEPASSQGCAGGDTLVAPVNWTTYPSQQFPYCHLDIDFTPVASLGGSPSKLLTEGLEIATNASPATQTITLTGTEIVLPAATPTFSIGGGMFLSTQMVSISDATPNSTIYYTTDGTTPTISSTVYSNPIVVSSTETLNAIATASGYSASAVATATYTIPQDFAVAINPSSVSVLGGQSGTATITVTDAGGFNSNVSFACSGLQAGATCSFSTLTAPTPLGVSFSTLTVSTVTTSGTLHRNFLQWLPGSSLALAFCGLGWKKRRRLQLLLLMAVGAAGLGLLTGCGGGSPSSGPPTHQPVTSTVTVTATSGSLSHSTTLTLTVD